MIAVNYILFAVFATALNLLTQYLSLQIYAGFFDLYLAMILGTLSGLVCKYVLDKKYIFKHTVKDSKDDAQKFILYSAMGVITTAIFWGTEILFDRIFENTPSAKYIGAVIGLSIGYVIKYFLDKKFVFRNSGLSSQNG